MYDVVCLYIGIAYVHAYVRICMWCEHMCVLICMWWCRFGVDDGFGIMVVSGCREYVTEPVDVVLVVTGRVLYVVGWAAACMYGDVVVVVLGGIIYDSVRCW